MSILKFNNHFFVLFSLIRSPNLILENGRHGFESDEGYGKTERDSRGGDRSALVKRPWSFAPKDLYDGSRHRRVLERSVGVRHLALHSALQNIKGHLKGCGDETSNHTDAHVLQRLLRHRLRLR